MHDPFLGGFRTAIAGVGLRSSLLRPSLGFFLSLLFALPTSAQHPNSTVVIHGRVQDALSGEPVGDAIVAAGDSATFVRADSDGAFAIPLRRGRPYVVSAERPGYAPSVFELPEGASSGLVVLVLEPVLFEIEGVEVFGESAITEVVGALERRRRSYAGRVVSYDRDRLATVPAQDALALVLLRAPGVHPCETLGGRPGILCRRVPRSRAATSFQADPGPSFASILICVDGMEVGMSQLAGMPMERIALFESFGQRTPDGSDGFSRTPDVGSVRIYTREWLASRWARLSMNAPVRWGC